MLSRTEQFDNSVRHGGVVVTKAEVLSGDEVLEDLVKRGAVVDGSVSVSRSAVERTASLQLVDTGDLTPTDVSDLLVPAGNQIRLWRGYKFNTPGVGGVDAEEYIPLGTFRFTAVSSTWPNISISDMYDRAWIVQGAILENVLTIPAGTNSVEAVESILGVAYPDLPTSFPSTDEGTTLMTFDADADPWAICQDLAANIGYRLTMDPMGTAVMVSEQEPVEGSVVWRFDDTDQDNIALPGAELSWSGTAYNAYIVVSDNQSLALPVRAKAYDLDPASPTQYGGKYGKRPAPLIRDEKIQNLGQAQTRANMELGNGVGLMQQINHSSLVHPCFQLSDVVGVNLTRQRIEQQFCAIDSFTVPMRAKNMEMPIGTRAKRILVNA